MIEQHRLVEQRDSKHTIKTLAIILAILIALIESPILAATTAYAAIEKTSADDSAYLVQNATPEQEGGYLAQSFRYKDGMKTLPESDIALQKEMSAPRNLLYAETPAQKISASIYDALNSAISFDEFANGTTVDDERAISGEEDIYIPDAYNCDDNGASPTSAVPNQDGATVFNWWDTFSRGYCTGVGAARVIDVSVWDGRINWSTVAQHADAAIVRCGYGSNIYEGGKWIQDDEWWEYNIAGCRANNIPFGVYIYSYAKDPSRGASEAEHVLRKMRDAGIGPSDLSLPVYYDLEDNSIRGTDHGAITRAFSDRTRSAGYEVGVYSSTSWFDGCLSDPIFDTLPRWIAQWNAGMGLTCTKAKDFHSSGDLWQFSDYGTIPGINARVDLSYTYRQSAYPYATPGTRTVQNGTYEIVSMLWGNPRLDVESGCNLNGANAHLWNSNGTTAQRFYLEYDGDGYYSVKNIYTNTYLDLCGASRGNKVNIHFWAHNGSAAQKWKILRNDDNTFTFVAKASGKVLDAANGRSHNGNNIWAYDLNWSPAQKWSIKSLEAAPGTQIIEDGIYEISTFLNKGKNLDIAGASTRDGANAQIYSKNGTDAQKFEVKYDGAGFYTIKNIGSGKYLDVFANYAADTTNVQQWTGNWREAQKWRIQKDGDGYNIISKANSKALDVENACIRDWTNVQIFSYNGTYAQKWGFAKIG